MPYAYLPGTRVRGGRLHHRLDPVLLKTLREEHWALIAALKVGDRAKLMRLVVDHIQHSKKIYLEVRRSV